MRKFLLIISTFLMISMSSVYAQDSETFYNLCVKDILSLKDKWPSVRNWKGEPELKPSYEVDKNTQIALAQEFMKTTLYQRACQQAMLPVGKMHQNDNKIIKSRTVGSVTFTAHFHEDEYIINLSKDYSTKKWKLEFSYTHNTFSTPPPTDNIDINIDGSQILAGENGASSYCVTANIAAYRYSKVKTGVNVSDSSAQNPCESINNDDLGKISSWDH